MRKVLFVSPHLDDAVFSCAARILQEAATGAQVTVATVFSHVRRRSAQATDYTARREEDRRALRLLGAKPRWLGLLDAPSRSPFYDSFRRIILETAPSDTDQIDIVREKLNRLIEELRPDAIYLPLAVGTHIDHRLVFAAGSALRSPSSRFFYEDQPYSSVRHAVGMRLQEIQAASLERDAISRETSALGGDSPALRSQRANLAVEFLKSFRAAPYVRRYLPAGSERKEYEDLLRQRLLVTSGSEIRWENEIERACPTDQPRIVASMYAYRSQAPHFLGSRQQFLTGCKRHALGLSLGGWRVERFWKSPFSDAIGV